MRKLQPGELGRLQGAQAQAMNDVCTILHISRVTGTYSDDEYSISTGTFQAPCGVNIVNGQIKSNGQVLLVDYDAVLRLPLSQSIGLTDRFVLQKGNALISGTFLPTELPEIGPSAQVLRLKRTT